MPIPPRRASPHTTAPSPLWTIGSGHGSKSQVVFIPFADSNVVCSKSVEAAANISHIGVRSILDKMVIKDSCE